MPIPRHIIQTHRDDTVEPVLRQTWIDNHPGYEYRFFDDAACLDFFRSDCPDLLETYEKLPLPVQKADLFRYACIYQYGGIYADVDTVCRVPIHDYVEMDTEQLVVGVEMTPADFKGSMAEYTHAYASPLQLLQWTFAAAPGHPALKSMLDRIHYTVAGSNSVEMARCSKVPRYTLETTGPMLFTHVLLDHMSSNADAGIRLLPQSYWGFHPQSNRKAELKETDIKVQHLFHGSWRVKKPESRSVKTNLFSRYLFSRRTPDR